VIFPQPLPSLHFPLSGSQTASSLPRGAVLQAADNGSTQEMNYLEFVEGVARVALQLYLSTLPEDKREEVDYKSPEVGTALEGQLEFLTAHIKELINSGTFS
jgi:hypothetical protein